MAGCQKTSSAHIQPPALEHEGGRGADWRPSKLWASGRVGKVATERSLQCAKGYMPQTCSAQKGTNATLTNTCYKKAFPTVLRPCLEARGSRRPGQGPWHAAAPAPAPRCPFDRGPAPRPRHQSPTCPATLTRCPWCGAQTRRSHHSRPTPRLPRTGRPQSSRTVRPWRPSCV